MRSMTIKLTTIKKKIKNGKEKVRIERCSTKVQEQYIQESLSKLPFSCTFPLHMDITLLGSLRLFKQYRGVIFSAKCR